MTKVVKSESNRAIVKEELLNMDYREDNYKRNIKKSTFWKTEQLLYHYKDFQEAIKDKELRIKEIEETGVINKSKSFSIYSTIPYNDLNESEKVNDLISNLEKSICKTKVFLNIIDNSLSKIKGDMYYDIIQLKYFDKLSGEQIAEKLDIDASTVSRNKNRLINTLKINLFSEDVIDEFFCS